MVALMAAISTLQTVQLRWARQFDCGVAALAQTGFIGYREFVGSLPAVYSDFLDLCYGIAFSSTWQPHEIRTQTHFWHTRTRYLEEQMDRSHRRFWPRDRVYRHNDVNDGMFLMCQSDVRTRLEAKSPLNVNSRFTITRRLLTSTSRRVSDKRLHACCCDIRWLARGHLVSAGLAFMSVVWTSMVSFPGCQILPRNWLAASLTARSLRKGHYAS